MGANKYTKLYQNICDQVRDSGLKLYHRNKIGDEIAAYYKNDKMIIAIEKQYVNTKMGCVFLAHELNHHFDYLDGKFPEFYNDDFLEMDRKEACKIILDAEFSAFTFPKKILKQHNIRFDNVPYFSKRWLKENLTECWIEYFQI